MEAWVWHQWYPTWIMEAAFGQVIAGAGGLGKARKRLAQGQEYRGQSDQIRLER